MSFDSGSKPPPVPSPIPIERMAEGIDESGKMEAERIRKMRGRMANYLTKGVLLAEPTVGTTKLGT